MKKAYTHIKGVFIAEPCQANWNEMDEVEKGRYCNHCSKIVYDFTNADPTEFFRMYKESGGNMCGNFYARPTIFERLRTQTGLLFANTKVAMIFFSLGLGILAHKGAKAQGQPILVENPVKENPTGFITVSVEVRKEGKKKLLKEEYSVEIRFDSYTSKLDKVTEGIAYFQIPAELIGTEATIIIKGSGYYYNEKHTITSTEPVKADIPKKRKRVVRGKMKRMGCPTF